MWYTKLLPACSVVIALALTIDQPFGLRAIVTLFLGLLAFGFACTLRRISRSRASLSEDEIKLGSSDMSNIGLSSPRSLMNRETFPNCTDLGKEFVEWY